MSASAEFQHVLGLYLEAEVDLRAARKRVVEALESASKARQERDGAVHQALRAMTESRNALYQAAKAFLEVHPSKRRPRDAAKAVLVDLVHDLHDEMEIPF